MVNKLSLEKAKEMMEQTGGWLDLSGTQITALPEGLTVGGSLYLRGTQITALPEGLTVGGWLDLSNTPITALPEGLTVGGWLDLSGTQIKALPEGLTIGGGLYLSNTPITALPEGLTIGGSLDLSGTQIKALPKGITIGGGLYLSGTQIKASDVKRVRRLKDGDYVAGKYIYCDGILTHIAKTKKAGDYTLYIGKIKGRNVVSDGTLYAHCKTLRDGIADIAFKRAAERGASQYKGIDMDVPIPLEEAKTMYRIITGACRAGTEHFAQSLGNKLQETYTVREMIKITKGQYNAEKFADFFGEE